MSRKPKTKTKPVRRIVIREGSPNRTPIKKRPAAIAEAAERLVELHSMKNQITRKEEIDCKPDGQGCWPRPAG